MATKNIILITGANGGIGFELASQLLADSSNHVLLGSRSAEKGQAAVKELQSRNQPGTVELLQIDVASEESISAAAKEVESKHDRLDALVNNAAIGPHSVPGTEGQKMSQVLATNVTGPMLTVDAFVPLLKKSPNIARIVNVTSGAGSIGTRLDSKNQHYSMKAVEYRTSKAALNMLSSCQAVEHGGEKFKVFLFCPGFTVSNLSTLNKAEHGAKPTSEGASPIVGILKGQRDNEHAGYLHVDGQYPW